jgi:aminoglycoside phosphotransferase (APT) family kinase protein
MNQSHHPHPVSAEQVEAIARHIFPAQDTQVERVLSGISTYVYRIISECKTYYLRILPDEEASFAPEITVLARLQQKHINIPEVVYFEDYNVILGRPIMVEAEIRGQSLSKSSLSKEVYERVAREAGRDLACINRLAIEGFGWIKPDQAHPTHLRGSHKTYRAFVLEYREADLTYLRGHVLKPQECIRLEHVLKRYDSWLDIEQGYLAHGDLDTTHIFQEQGSYTGIIDFGEVRSTGRWYDLAHFRIRDGAFPSYRLFQALERGYAEIMPFPPEYEQYLRFTSVLINLRALSRAFQTRTPDEYIWRQLEMLHDDLLTLD